MSEFDPQAAVASLKRRRRIMRKPRPSRLTRYASQLLAMRAHGATVADLQRWLRQQHVHVAHSTVSRWLVRHG